MPTYAITVKPHLLTEPQKDQIAQLITKTHTEVTGAPNYFAQIIFHEDGCSRYIGGQKSDTQIWIRADIRAGRTVEQRKRLIQKIIDGVSEIAQVAKTDIWIYLNNMEATDMAEFGQLLSEPGKEAEWFAALPSVLQKRLSAMSKL